MHFYRIEITSDEEQTIHTVGYRYGWSDAFFNECTEDEDETAAEDGLTVYLFDEPSAWRWRDAVEEDMEGGHSAFPMLNPACSLAAKLAALHEDIV